MVVLSITILIFGVIAGIYVLRQHYREKEERREIIEDRLNEIRNL